MACPYLGPPDKEEDRRAACGSTPSTYNGGKCVENACSSVTRVQWHCTGVVCNNTIVLMQGSSSMQREISLNACGEVQGQGFGWNNRGGATQTIITHPIQATTVNKGWRLAVLSQPSLDHISNFSSQSIHLPELVVNMMLVYIGVSESINLALRTCSCQGLKK